MADDRRRTLLVGALVGAVVGLVVGGAVVAGAGAWLLPGDRSVSPTASMTTATGCVADPTEGGWVGRVTVEERVVVVFNYTLVHDAAELDVRGDLESPTDRRHEFAITTAPVTDGGKGTPPSDCRPRTEIEASVSLPREFGTLTVTVDGRPIARVTSGPSAGPSFRRISPTA